MDEKTDEIIFGKNAVLSFLEQSEAEEEPADHRILKNALIQDALQQAQRLSASSPDSEVQSLERKIHEAVRKLQDQPHALPPKTEALWMRNHKQGSAKVNKILLAVGTERDGRVRQIKSIARAQQIPVHTCDRKKLDQIAGPQRRHQGVLAMVSPAEIWLLDTLLQKLVFDRIVREFHGRNMDGYVVAVLDGIEDPHNLGAIIRVAEAAGVKALIIPQRRAAGLTGTVAKTSAGAVANLPVVRVGNLVQCLETLKKYGFWVTALDLEAQDIYSEADLVRPLVVVIGAEGTGVSRLVKEHCDFSLKIPMLGKTESLNASVSAGIVFYEVVRQLRAKNLLF